MAKNLGGAIIDLLDSERVELRVAAATVLAVVGKGDKSVTEALTDATRRQRCRRPHGSRSKGSRRWTSAAPAASRPSSCRCSAATTKRSPSAPRRCSRSRAPRPRRRCARKSRAGPVAARRVMAQLLLRRGTQPAIDAVLDQLPDDEFGEQALQLVRAELDAGNDKLANQIEKIGGRAARAKPRRSCTRRGRKRRRPPRPPRRTAKAREERQAEERQAERPRTATARTATPCRRRSAARSRRRARRRRARRAAPPHRLPRAAVDAVAARSSTPIPSSRGRSGSPRSPACAGSSRRARRAAPRR